MIGTYLYPDQGLGNQLWSYYAMRLIAKYLGMPYTLLGFDNFKGKNFISLDAGVQVAAPHRSGPNHNLFPPFRNYYSERQVVFSREHCDVRSFDPKCLQLDSYTLIDGYFQSEELLSHVEHCIDDFIKVHDLPYLNYLNHDGVCVLNIRGGIYKSNKRLTLNKKYWVNAMNHMVRFKRVSDFVIVTDDPIYAQQLFPKIPVLEQDMHHDFVSLMHAKNLIISNSSFSYFPIRFNSNDPYVIAPKYWARHNVSDGFWACRSNIYSSYFYLDRSGSVFDAKTCEREADEFIFNNFDLFIAKEHAHVARYPNRLLSFLRNRLVKYD